MADSILYSINRFPGNGTQRVFEISFAGGYISKQHVVAQLERPLLDPMILEITWVNDSTIQVPVAPGLGETLGVYRRTPKDKPLTDFADGAIIDEKSLDTLAEQAVFLAAEASDQTEDAVKTILDSAAVVANQVSEQVRPLFGNGAPSPDTGILGSIYYDMSQGPDLYGPKQIVGNWGLPKSLRGVAGPSNNTRITLSDLKAANINDISSIYDGAVWTWRTGDYTGKADDINIVASNGVALSVGAWVRGFSDALTVNTVAELRARPTFLLRHGTVVKTLGFHAPRDQGGGEFYWSSTATNTDNSGIIIRPDSVSASSPGRWLRILTSGKINLRWFGAKGDGVTLDDVAIDAWLRYALSGRVAGSYVGNMGSFEAYAPKGQYRWTVSGLFSPNVPTWGAKISGDGPWSSLFVHDPTQSTGEVWAFNNNGANGTSPTALTLTDVGFFADTVSKSPPSDIPTRIHFWQILSNSYEQGYRFERIAVVGFTNVYDWRGNNVNSEVFHHQCYYDLNRGFFYRIRNPQAYNHNLVACSVIQYGDILRSETEVVGSTTNLGSPVLHMWGGQVIMAGDPAGGFSYFANCQPSSVGVNITPMLVSGVRFELRTAQCKLFYNAPDHVADLVFSECNFLLGIDAPGVFVDLVVCNRGSVVIFDKSTIDPLFGATATMSCPNDTFGFTRPGEIYFRDCRVPDAMADWMVRPTFGRIVSTDSKTLRVNAASGDAVLVQDFALGDPGPGGGKRYPVTIEGFTPYTRGWPGGNNLVTRDEWIIRFAKDEVLREIHIEADAGSVDTTLVSYIVGSNDKAIIYGQTPATAYNTKQVLHLRDLNIKLDDDNKRRIRVWAANATANRKSGGTITFVTRG